MRGDSVRSGAAAAAPFAVADLLDGLAFGATAVALGLRPLPAIVMSATAFSGSAQFASLTVVREHGSELALLATVVALNSRYLVYGSSLAPVLAGNPLLRAAQAHLITDSSWALSLRSSRPRRAILLGAGGASLAGWTLGTAGGAYAGSVIGNYRAVGLDALLPAFFVCLLFERIARRGGGVPAAFAAAAVAVTLAGVAPPGVALLAVLAIALIGTR